MLRLYPWARDPVYCRIGTSAKQRQRHRVDACRRRCVPRIFFIKLAKAVGELLVPPPALTRLHAGLLEPCMAYPCFGLIFPAIGSLLDSLVDSLVEVAPEFRHLTGFPSPLLS